MVNIKSVYIIILVSLMAGVIGFFIHPYFVKLSILEMKDVNVITLDKESAFNLKILMGIIFTFIPLFFFTVEKVLNLEKQREKLFIWISIILSGILFWQFKLYSIKERSLELKAQPNGNLINYVFAQENLNIEFYLFIGFIVGAVISGVALYRFRNKK